MIHHRMNNRIAAVSLASAALIAGCSSAKDTTPTNPEPGLPNVAVCPATIAISGLSYVPASCKVAPGATVTIQASANHPLSGSGAGATAVSGATAAQAIVLRSAGTFTFSCNVHGNVGMTGSITVQ